MPAPLPPEPTPDIRIVPCGHCGTEGCLYHGDGSRIWDYVETCPSCDGTGGELIDAELVEEADLFEECAS